MWNATRGPMGRLWNRFRGRWCASTRSSSAETVKARTNFAGPDALLCTLEGSLTISEQNLDGMGEGRQIRDVRSFFQHACEKDFVGIIEDHLDRKVRGFFSGIDVRRDISSEVFYLEPRRSPEPQT